MSYIALYRKWRPVTFDDVVEQSGVVSILKNAVKQDRIGHAYLFCGTRGTGKTTIAKIYSRAINCLEPHDGNPCNECEVCSGILNQSLLDVIEIDAASNNGVDNVRDIIEEIAYVPARAKYKVYIIDEVHMLSTGAFNALLKTLEEPPGHAVFLLATTDPQKLPATILSRCQRFEFKRISLDSIVSRLETICIETGKEAEKDALYFIAQAADGALRDAISILDQCISAGNSKLILDDVMNILGITNEQFLARTAESIIDKDVDSLLTSIDSMVKEGKEIPEFIGSLITYFRNMLVVKAAGYDASMISMSTNAVEEIKRIGGKTSQINLINFVKELSSLERDIKWASQKKIILEVGLIKLCIEEELVNNTSAMPGSNGRQVETVKVAEIRDVKPVSQSKPISGTGQSGSSQVSSASTASTTSRTSGENKKSGENRPSGLLVKMKPVEEENLKEIFLDLKEGKHMMVMSYLRNVRALYHNDNVIYLVFCGAGKEIKKDSMAKPENMKIISSVFQKVLDRDCAVRLYTEDELSGKQEDTKESNDDDVISRIGRLEKDGIQVEFE